MQKVLFMQKGTSSKENNTFFKQKGTIFQAKGHFLIKFFFFYKQEDFF